jgi:hypothetical protein
MWLSVDFWRGSSLPDKKALNLLVIKLQAVSTPVFFSTSSLKQNVRPNNFNLQEEVRVLDIFIIVRNNV